MKLVTPIKKPVTPMNKIFGKQSYQKAYKLGRVCGVCDTILSMYNKGRTCYACKKKK